ncbi:sodium/calcium exchanger regulatory protein 1-like isoform X2 [Ostrea edulis]|uniref:sodium/calcium exchanger regulatory protein 1-like isoform X2 n=1 Tax=Ostrea edulis TaxID=37623 RepID=UPI002096600E|nr:sodium/calcium exchanger regulatory protein 1-like isoform X2 [Ostrea edulis]
MAQFNGKWEIECSEKFSEYMHAIGVSEDKQAEAQKFLGDSSKLTYEISSSGNDWVFKITTAAGEREVKFSLGSEIDTMTLDGRAIKTVFTLDGDALMEKQTGSGFETTNKRTVSGNTMTMVMTAGNGISCTRKYKKI